MSSLDIAVVSNFPLPLGTAWICSSNPSWRRGLKSQAAGQRPPRSQPSRSARLPLSHAAQLRDDRSAPFPAERGSKESAATLSKHQRVFDQQGSTERRSPRGARQVRRQHQGRGTFIFSTVTREDLFEEVELFAAPRRTRRHSVSFWSHSCSELLLGPMVQEPY